jgi:hypothetical protein
MTSGLCNNNGRNFLVSWVVRRSRAARHARTRGPKNEEDICCLCRGRNDCRFAHRYARNLHHREGPGRLALRDRFGLPETELGRCSPKLLRVRYAPDARTRRAHGSFDEDRIGCDVPKIVRARNHEGLRLRRADSFQRAKRRNLVLHSREARERRHDSRDTEVFPARRQHSHLLLRWKQQVGLAFACDALGGREPAERIEPEARDIVYRPYMPREPRQADFRRRENLDLVPERTELSCDLNGR